MTMSTNFSDAQVSVINAADLNELSVLLEGLHSTLEDLEQTTFHMLVKAKAWLFFYQDLEGKRGYDALKAVLNPVFRSLVGNDWANEKFLSTLEYILNHVGTPSPHTPNEARSAIALIAHHCNPSCDSLDFLSDFISPHELTADFELGWLKEQEESILLGLRRFIGRCEELLFPELQVATTVEELIAVLPHDREFPVPPLDSLYSYCRCTEERDRHEARYCLSNISFTRCFSDDFRASFYTKLDELLYEDYYPARLISDRPVMEEIESLLPEWIVRTLR